MPKPISKKPNIEQSPKQNPELYSMGSDAQLKAMTTMVFRLYHQQPGDNPTEFLISNTKEGSDGSQCLSRTMEVGEEWVDLDFAWVEDPALVWIENQTGRDSRVVVSDAVKAEVAKSIIEVSPHKLCVSPGMANVISPMENGTIRVRSLHGKAKLKYGGLPR